MNSEKPPASKMKRCWLIVPGRKLLFTPDKRDYVATMKKAASK